MALRCIMCGGIIEEELFQPDPYDDDEDMPKKPVSFCLKCQAKLKYEADESQKVPKPI